MKTAQSILLVKFESLSRKVQHVSHEKSPELVVEMDRRSGYAFHNDSPSTSKHCISYAGLRVSITERIEAWTNEPNGHNHIVVLHSVDPGE